MLSVLCLVVLLGVARGYEDKTVAQYLQDNPSQFSTLTKYLTDTGVINELGGAGPFTIFAPTNAALAAADAATLISLESNNKEMEDVLRYHVINEFVLVPMVSQPQSKPSIEGQAVNITSAGGSLLVNGVAQVDGTNHDIIVNNGVIQPIDKLLLPPKRATLNIAQVILKDDTRFKDFFLAMLLAGLDKELESGDFTVFAPVDNAFVEYRNSLLSPDAPNAQAVYKAVLNNHVVPGGRKANQIHDGQQLFTLSGKFLTVHKGAGNSFTVNGANVLETDILATNGVIHAIDKLLVPNDISTVIQG